MNLTSFYCLMFQNEMIFVLAEDKMYNQGNTLN